MGAMAISTLAGARLVENAPTRRSSRAELAAVSQGLHGILLGHGDVVDSHAARARRMALRYPAVPGSGYDPLYSARCSLWECTASPRGKWRRR